MARAARRALYLSAGSLALVGLLQIVEGCNNQEPTPDPTLNPKACTVTLLVRNMIIGDADPNVAMYDWKTLPDIYANMRVSCPKEVAHISDVSRWPYSKDEATLLTDNFLLAHDASTYEADPLFDLLRTVDTPLEVPANIDTIDWRPLKVARYLRHIDAFQRELIAAGAMQESYYTDTGEYKKVRPVYMMFVQGPVDAVQSYYGMTAAGARVSMINTKQINAALSFGWLPAEGDRTGWPYTDMSEEAWIKVHVRMHELFHHLVAYSDAHHDCSISNMCVAGSFGDSGCKYGAVSACLACWQRVFTHFRWQVYLLEP